MRVRLIGDAPGYYRLFLDDQDITESAFVVGVDIHADGRTADVVVRLELAYEPIEVDIDAPAVVLDATTTALLQKLGWSAPIAAAFTTTNGE